MTEKVLPQFQDKLSKILSELLPLTKPLIREAKVIHDPLWGSRLFYPWEIALLDTPLIQRLRQISQLGSAFLTYPSAVHNRFSHSLGVCILAARLITRLREKAEIKKQNIEITKRDIYTVRLAGLLHDIGHCFFSHCSEKVLQKIIDVPMREIEIFESSKKPKTHEFISFLIVNHPHFHRFWHDFVVPLFPEPEQVPSPDDVAKIIVGVSPSKSKRYLKDIISGPYDVDKLEYLYRDAKMAGLEISYDVERYFYKISLIPHNDQWRLAMDLGGVRAVEQIIFSKMMLFSFVYHHQKVLAADCIINDLLLELLTHDVPGSIKIEHPLDFLSYTDYDILAWSTTERRSGFGLLKKRLQHRQLPKRCFVLNKEFVKDIDHDDNTKFNWERLKRDLHGDIEKLQGIRRELAERISKLNSTGPISINDVYINFPEIPSIDEVATAPVIDAVGQLTGMGNFFDLQGWQKTYDLKKLRGYFYATDHICSVAADAVEEFLKDRYDIELKENARAEAKMVKCALADLPSPKISV